jgi:hypothetical protein
LLSSTYRSIVSFTRFTNTELVNGRSVERA